MSDVTASSIFDPERDRDPVLMQRRAGFFVLNDINPALIPSTPVKVWKLGKGRVRVNFTRIFPQSSAPKSWEQMIPDGHICGHGGFETESHEASRWDSIETSWSEVKA